MKIVELLGEPTELTRSLYPPTNLDILKHLAWKRRQLRKSPGASSGGYLFLLVADELVKLGTDVEISPYPRRYLYQ